MSTAAAQSRTPTRAAGTWAALSHGVFRLFWIFSFVAFIGASMQSVAAGWLMVRLGGSPFAVSLVQGTMSLAVLLAALPAGAIADLHDRRTLMLLALGGLMAATGGIGLLARTGALTAPLLLGLTFLSGLAAAVLTPVMQSTIPHLVPRHHLPSAVTLNGMTGSAARSVGPAVAGLLIGAVGAGLTLMANVLAFAGLWLVVFAWRSAGAAHPPADRPRAPLLSALREGLGFAVKDRVFSRLLLRTGTCFAGTSAVLALMPSVVAVRFPAAASSGARDLGLLLSAYGVGSVLGSLSLARLTAWLGRERLVLAMTAGSGLDLLALVFGRELWLMTCTLLFAGWLWGAAMTAINVATQLALPRALLARGLSISMMALMVSLALGSAVWGEVATLLDVDGALACAGLVTLAISAAHAAIDRAAGASAIPPGMS